MLPSQMAWQQLKNKTLMLSPMQWSIGLLAGSCTAWHGVHPPVQP